VSTFDGFANSFDAKLAQLDYKAPALVAQAVSSALGEPSGQLLIADAGCGTGLCAPYLKPYALRLVGVDLSGPMLDKARARLLYDELVQADLTQFLLANADVYDLLVSADTLCYFGRLDEFAVAARASLHAGGLLVFTVEAHDASGDGRPWRLQPHGRYSHRRDYLEAVLTAAGFAPPTLEGVVLRNEALKPVHGWLVSARVPEGGSHHG
jgi:predicted TPR repeat methyltransferase